VKFELWPTRERLQVVGIVWKLIEQEKPIEAFWAVTVPNCGADAEEETERFIMGVPGSTITGVLDALSDAPVAFCAQLKPGQGTRTPDW